MKTRNITIALMMGVLTAFTSCIDKDWDTPVGYTYGNANIEETNVISIAQLKKQFASSISTGYAYDKVTSDIKIKGVVTGNDNGGNICTMRYRCRMLREPFWYVSAPVGYFAYMPVGQTLLIDLKDLYVGNYGNQGQIGTPYTNEKGKTYLGMTSNVWEQHVKLIGEPDKANLPTPLDFTPDLNLADHCGELIVFKNVSFTDADGKATFAPDAAKDAGNGVDRTFVGYSSSKVVLRTSAFCDFANSIMPTGKVNVTGIATRYSNKWQIYMRTINDIEQVK
jgi:hypothetical protein